MPSKELPVKSQVQGILCQGQVLRHKVIALGEHGFLHSWDQTGLFVQTLKKWNEWWWLDTHLPWFRLPLLLLSLHTATMLSSLQHIPNYFPVWKHFLASCCQQKSLISAEPMKSAKTEMRDNIVIFSQLIGNGPFPVNLFSVFKRSYFCADIGFIIVRGFKKKKLKENPSKMRRDLFW